MSKSNSFKTKTFKSHFIVALRCDGHSVLFHSVNSMELSPMPSGCVSTCRFRSWPLKYQFAGRLSKSSLFETKILKPDLVLDLLSDGHSVPFHSLKGMGTFVHGRPLCAGVPFQIQFWNWNRDLLTVFVFKFTVWWICDPFEPCEWHGSVGGGWSVPLERLRKKVLAAIQPWWANRLFSCIHYTCIHRGLSIKTQKHIKSMWLRGFW